MSKKLISIVVPNYNEAATLDELYERTTKVMQSLTKYDYEIVFFDDGSKDGSRKKIEELCSKDEHIKAVFYSKNFGYAKGTFYCFQQAKGDCAIILHADLQNPPEEIPRLVEKWETGAQIVFGVKNQSRENKFVYFIRTIFYWVINNIFGVRSPQKMRLSSWNTTICRSFPQTSLLRVPSLSCLTRVLLIFSRESIQTSLSFVVLFMNMAHPLNLFIILRKNERKVRANSPFLNTMTLQFVVL